MLRDLDQRHGHGTRSADAALGRPPFAAGLTQGTHSIAAGRTGVSRARTGRRIGLAVVACAVLVAAAWYARQHSGLGVVNVPAQVASTASIGPTTPQPTTSAVPQVPEAPVLVPVNAPELNSGSVLEVAPVALTPDRSVPLVTQPAVFPPAVVARGASESRPAPVVALRMEPMLSTRQLAASAVEAKSSSPQPSKPASPVTDAAPNLQRQQQASADALAQAQTLWSAGSQAAAIDLLQQGVDAAERAVKAGSSPPGNPVLLSLVREWARMQMAQGRYGPVWDTLSRLEPVLGNAPDLWGLRGNTAQRLGHHADSVRAYTTALQSRPTEQRWMLGAAVSMAALGQTDQAAAMAERAQSVGDISREVQTYLHQMGVPLKAR